MIKSKKISELAKFDNYLKNYPFIALIENNNIQNKDIQNIRKNFSCKVLFIKKKILLKKYSIFNIKKNFFLIFGDQNLKSHLENTTFLDFALQNEKSNKDVLIKAGEIKKTDLLKFLKIEEKGSKKILKEDFLLCKENSLINEEQSEILKILGTRVFNRKINILAFLPSNEVI